MSEIISLPATIREQTGTGSARALREKGMVPANIYGNNKDNIAFAIEEKEITKSFRKPQFMSQVFEFEIAKKKYQAIPKEVQLHPITEKVTHADFTYIGDKIQKMRVPLVFKNKANCIGVKRGGYFNTVRRYITLECDVTNLPRKVELDVTDIPVGSVLKIKDLSLPEGTKLLEKESIVIASIIGKRGRVEATDEAEGAAPASK